MAISPELRKAKREIYDIVRDMRSKINQYKKEGNIDRWKNLEHDYYAIVRAIKEGAEEISDIDIKFCSEIVIKIMQSYQEEYAKEDIKADKEEHDNPFETSNSDIISHIFDGTLYHCIINGQAFGPVTISQFANMARYGIVNANTMVWTQGMSQWAIAQSIAELQTVV